MAKSKKSKAPVKTTKKPPATKGSKKNLAMGMNFLEGMPGPRKRKRGV